MHIDSLTFTDVTSGKKSFCAFAFLWLELMVGSVCVVPPNASDVAVLCSVCINKHVITGRRVCTRLFLRGALKTAT